MKKIAGVVISFLFVLTIKAQIKQTATVPDSLYVSKVWVADNGDGTYKNPIIHADYSDPDAIRVGNNYYMIASSFDAVPGIPILQSKDLVNWTIIGHALNKQIPVDYFSSTQHGNGVWAPAIRYHNDEFYIYYPDPDYGIYLIKAKNIAGPWSAPTLVEAGKGLIDPCPFWDDNGNAYMIHAYAGSRAGIKSILVIKRLNVAGNKTTDKGVVVYDGHENDPTIEGPKLYKYKDYYYIFAPAGGVTNGWQLVLRSKNIYGTYERKVVMNQGGTTINGPHQGAWVQTQTGEDWFIHFQDKGAYGRVIHLQPMHWKDQWPVIGIDTNNIGKGEPILTYKKPNVGKQYPICTPQESDEFNDSLLGKQWQWQANPKQDWAIPSAKTGTLRLNAQTITDTAKTYWDVPNILLQKFPAEEFSAVTKLSFNPSTVNEKTGLIIMGLSYAYVSLINKEDGIYIDYVVCTRADKDTVEHDVILTKVNSLTVYLKVNVAKGAVCRFSYSEDGEAFQPITMPFNAKPGKWIGAKVGLFCTAKAQTNGNGYVDIDWFRIEKND